MKEFYEPMLYLSTPDHPNTMGVIAELKESIDGEILNSVVQELSSVGIEYEVTRKEPLCLCGIEPFESC